MRESFAKTPLPKDRWKKGPVNFVQSCNNIDVSYAEGPAQSKSTIRIQSPAFRQPFSVLIVEPLEKL